MKKIIFLIPLLMIFLEISFAQSFKKTAGKYKDMALINAKNNSFMMGFTEEEAGIEYACYVGKHKVTFTYDWYMDSTLVTQDDYLKLMHKNPSFHKGDLQLPVEFVSWYDAVLYCNERSKRDNLDTVYTYTSIVTNDTTVRNLEGLKYNIYKNGYRLPTNAEYEYTERADLPGRYFFCDTTQNIDSLANEYAWSKLNSGLTTHPVHQKKMHPWGLYDIIGNVFEWTGDWEGRYESGPVTDPVGPADGKTECGTHWIGSEKKMAKGGSLKTDVKGHMRISYHYKWPPATTSWENGFRCVATKK